MNALKLWMRAATPEEQQLLAERAGTSRQYLYQLSGGHRQASAELGAAIEAATRAMARASKGRLPAIYRTDLVSACRECEYAQRCLRDRAVASQFPFVTAEMLGDSEGGAAD